MVLVINHFLSRSTALGHCEILYFLLESLEDSSDIDVQDNIHATPAHDAAEYGQTEAMILLLRHGANVNIKDTVSHRSLRYVCTCNTIGGAWILRLIRADHCHCGGFYVHPVTSQRGSVTEEVEWEGGMKPRKYLYYGPGHLSHYFSPCYYENFACKWYRVNLHCLISSWTLITVSLLL